MTALTEANEFLEVRFGKDGHGEGFGFLIFRTRFGADDDVIGFLADRAGDFSAVLLDKPLGFFTGAVGEAAGEDKRFPGELLAFHLALFRRGADAGLAKLLHEVAVRGFGEEFSDALGNLRAE